MKGKFDHEKQENIRKQGGDLLLRGSSLKWLVDSSKYKYSYNFTWLGRPIIQFPQDMVAMQEIIWLLKPDLIIETGIAHGGSLVFYASMLELVGGNGQVLGIDLDIRQDNRSAITKHPMAKRIMMLEGSSTDASIVQEAYSVAKNKTSVLIVLDSNHTHDHVLQELNAYSPLVKKDSYIVVFDTVIEDMPADSFQDRPWGKGNNPKTAVWEFMKTNNRFVIDKEVENKLLITVAPDGYLRCIED